MIKISFDELQIDVQLQFIHFQRYIQTFGMEIRGSTRNSFGTSSMILNSILGDILTDPNR